MNHKVIIISIGLLIIALIVGGIVVFSDGRPPIGPGSEPMTTERFAACDLDGDGDCDSNDLAIFTNALGQCDTGNNYNTVADADHDGCVSGDDEKILFPSQPTSTATSSLVE